MSPHILNTMVITRIFKFFYLLHCEALSLLLSLADYQSLIIFWTFYGLLAEVRLGIDTHTDGLDMSQGWSWGRLISQVLVKVVDTDCCLRITQTTRLVLVGESIGDFYV